VEFARDDVLVPGRWCSGRRATEVVAAAAAAVRPAGRASERAEGGFPRMRRWDLRLGPERPFAGDVDIGRQLVTVRSQSRDESPMASLVS
jgi:hypothetical protein